MQITYLDMETYPRKVRFEHFLTLFYPYTGVTVNVDITDYLASLKKSGLLFFLSFLYTIAGTANHVPEFRRRIH